MGIKINPGQFCAHYVTLRHVSSVRSVHSNHSMSAMCNVRSTSWEIFSVSRHFTFARSLDPPLTFSLTAVLTKKVCLTLFSPDASHCQYYYVKQVHYFYWHDTAVKGPMLLFCSFLENILNFSVLKFETQLFPSVVLTYIYAVFAVIHIHSYYSDTFLFVLSWVADI